MDGQNFDIRKSILIVKIQKTSLAAAEQFLRNRDWLIHSTTNIKEALQYVLTNKPSFVMICVDHPNKKIRSLPKLLSSALPLCVIAYTEANNTQAFRILMDSGCEYKINPPVTGPAIERTVNKFIRDQQNAMMKSHSDEIKAREASERVGGVAGESTGRSKKTSSEESDGSFVISGSKSEKSKITGSIEDQELEEAQKLLMQMSNEEDTSFLSDSGDDSESGGSFEPEKLGRKSGIAYMPDASGAKPGNNFEPGGMNPEDQEGEFEPDRLGSKLGAAYNPQQAKKNNRESTQSNSENSVGQEPGFKGGEFEPDQLGSQGYHPEQSSQKRNHDLSSAETNQKNQKNQEAASLQPDDPNDLVNFLKKLTPKKKKSLAHDGQEVTYDENDIEAMEAIRKKIAEAPSLSGHEGHTIDPIDPQQVDAKEIEEKESRVGASVFGEKGFHKNETIIVKGTQKALEESSDIGDGVVQDKLAQNSNVACIVIESPRFSGYLVAAMGKNRRIDQSFIDSVKKRLFKFLVENGEVLDEKEETMGIKIQQVDFEDWAIEHADFLRKSIHNGDEVAMAFFPFAQAKTVVGESAHQDMAAIGIEDLKPDEPVEFNVYIYLPNNGRYVLYTPKGGKFYGAQKKRLEKMGVREMHLKKDEIQELGKYRAQNYLNSKITEYHQKKKGSKAS